MTSVSLSDPELVALMARGDRVALGTLYERHAPRLCALAKHILGAQGDAEDLLHDVFLEAWRHAADYTPSRGSVWSWLSVRTRSRAIDRRRASAPQRNLELIEEELESRSTLEPSAEPSTGTARLQVALAGMSREEREVLLLGYFEGLSSSEIAERVGIPLGTVKSRTRSALLKLRAQFSEGGAA